MQVGDYVAVGTEWGRVRSMRSAAGVAIKEALPGQPVEVAGLRGVPQAGDELMVLPRYRRSICPTTIFGDLPQSHDSKVQVALSSPAGGRLPLIQEDSGLGQGTSDVRHVWALQR